MLVIETAGAHDHRSVFGIAMPSRQKYLQRDHSRFQQRNGYSWT